MWRDISDAPRDGTHIDLWIPFGDFNPDEFDDDIIAGRVCGAYWNNKRERFELKGSWNIVHVVRGATHWMEPPAPPEYPDDPD